MVPPGKSLWIRTGSSRQTVYPNRPGCHRPAERFHADRPPRLWWNVSLPGRWRCCGNRNWSACSQSTVFSTVNAIRGGPSEASHAVQDLTAEHRFTSLARWTPRSKSVSDDHRAVRRHGPSACGVAGGWPRVPRSGDTPPELACHSWPSACQMVPSVRQRSHACSTASRLRGAMAST
jgi:hypothetical protein